MWNASERIAADRLRELAHDPVASSYLVGYLLAGTDPEDWPDLVEAALVYRERFGASGNDHRKGCVQAAAHVARCVRCSEEIVTMVVDAYERDRFGR